MYDSTREKFTQILQFSMGSRVNHDVMDYGSIQSCKSKWDSFITIKKNTHVLYTLQDLSYFLKS